MVDSLDEAKKLEAARAAIDEADAQIAEALANRFRAVTTVGAYKHRSGLSAVDETRRQAVIDKAIANALAAGGDPVLAEKLYELMTDYCADIQQEYINSGTGPLADYYEKGFEQKPDGTLTATHFDGQGQRITSAFQKAADGKAIRYHHMVTITDEETQQECVMRSETREFANDTRMPNDVRALYRQLTAKFS